MDFGFSAVQEVFRQELDSFFRSDEVREELWRMKQSSGEVDPRPLYRRMGAQNLMVPNWPVALGGRGLSGLDQAAVLEAMSDHFIPDTLYVISVQIVGALLLHGASPALQKKLLPPLGRGEQFACVLYTEPNAGSDLAGLTTTAVPCGEGRFALHGRKVYSMKTHLADYAICAARTAGDGSRYDSITLFVVPLHEAGVRVRPIPSITDESFYEVVLEGVEVGLDDVVGEVGGGWTVITKALALERTGHDYYVKARRWFAALSAHAAERGLLDTPDVAMQLSRLGAQLDASRLLCYRAIGRPIPNHRALVVDEHLHPVPIGALGELLIGGVGLARGYMNRPDLTAERFIPAPSSLAGGHVEERLYRTGDLVRWLPDGTLEFMGRVDRQVKIRGFRIELGEVEAALAGYPGVREAVVQVQSDHRGVYLVAYLVVAAAPAPTTAAVREFLSRNLPDYMLPSYVIVLDRLPLTPHGKLDQRALPLPSEEGSGQQDGFEPPEGDVETRIAGEVFGPVLGVSQVGRRENFFDLGGNSLQGTQIVSRLRSLFGVEISLADFFLAPTVSHMARLVEQGQQRNSQERDALFSVLAGLEQGEQSRIPASDWQVRLWERWQSDPMGTFAHMPFALRLSGPLEPQHLISSLQQIVRRHQALRTGFQPDADGLAQVIDPAAELAVPLDDLSTLDPETRQERYQALAAEAAESPFDLARPPLMRARLIRLAPDEHALLLTMHHAVYDGWSGGIFFRELVTLYNAACGGEQACLPEPQHQYADFARWQCDWLGSPERERQQAYWQERLQDAPPLAEPCDTQGFDRQWLALALPRELSDQVKALGARQGASLFMTLLAGFATALGQVTGQTDLTIGTNIAGRNRTEWESVIGMFVNGLALRLDLSAAGSFTGLIDQTKRVAAAAYGHQDLPFGELLRSAGPVSEAGRAPLFQAMFALQNTPGGGDSLTGLQVEVIRDPNGPAVAPILEFYSPHPARLDISLAMSDRAEGLMGTLEFNRHRFDRETAEHLIAAFMQVLQSAVAQGGSPR